MAIVRRDETTPALRRTTPEWDPFQSMRELMRWDPFREMLPALGTAGPAGFAPAFDVRETKDAYLFKADLPGFREEDIDLNVSGNRLTISGQRQSEKVEDSDT